MRLRLSAGVWYIGWRCGGVQDERRCVVSHVNSALFFLCEMLRRSNYRVSARGSAWDGMFDRAETGGGIEERMPLCRGLYARGFPH